MSCGLFLILLPEGIINASKQPGIEKLKHGNFMSSVLRDRGAAASPASLSVMYTTPSVCDYSTTIVLVVFFNNSCIRLAKLKACFCSKNTSIDLFSLHFQFSSSLQRRTFHIDFFLVWCQSQFRKWILTSSP